MIPLLLQISGHLDTFKLMNMEQLMGSQTTLQEGELDLQKPGFQLPR